VAKNKLSDLNDHLFEALESLKDSDKPMEIARAKAISGVAQTIINAAKLQLDFYKAQERLSEEDGKFFGNGAAKRPRLVEGAKAGRA
jgi:hypothetical protein